MTYDELLPLDKMFELLEILLKSVPDIIGGSKRGRPDLRHIIFLISYSIFMQYFWCPSYENPGSVPVPPMKILDPHVVTCTGFVASDFQ